MGCANILGHHHHHDNVHNHTHDVKSKKKHKKNKSQERGNWSVFFDSYLSDWDRIIGKFESLMTKPEDIEDLNRRGAYLHVLADALVSVLVIIALVIGMFNSKFVMLDPLIGILAGVVIARWSISLLKESRNELLELN